MAASNQINSEQARERLIRSPDADGTRRNLENLTVPARHRFNHVLSAALQCFVPLRPGVERE
jgi:hypothetical protein